MLAAGPPGSFKATILTLYHLESLRAETKQAGTPKTTQDTLSEQQNKTTPPLQRATAVSISWRATEGYQQLRKEFNHKYRAKPITVYMDSGSTATKTPTPPTTASKGRHLAEGGAPKVSCLPWKYLTGTQDIRGWKGPLQRNSSSC